MGVDRTDSPLRSAAGQLPSVPCVTQVPNRQEAMELLRRFEPEVRYTKGERFFPMDVERYISECSLWVQPPDGPPQLLVPEGELTIEELVQPRSHKFGTVYYLKLIEPLDILELARYSFNKAVETWTRRLSGDEVFRPGRGRLSRVGLVSRLLDALFSITLFLRGRVPGDTAAAAALTYRHLQSQEECYCYYGRALRQNGWLVMQYWFFYPFNNWRSGFFGVNDHEGDWEMITLYCSEDLETPRGDPDRVQPHWVAYASHDFSGDDLRRRWDDPEVVKVHDAQGNEHPVIFAGAGSHASYFSPGEYLAELELPFLKPLGRAIRFLQRGWNTVFGETGSGQDEQRLPVFSVPFVDYARGDGLTIGPSGHRQWNLEVIDSRTPWAAEYRGLWGLYAKDPISGENAPAGPIYNRDGSVRRAWFDPLGWSGLDKLPPPDEALQVLEQRERSVQGRLADLEGTIDEKSRLLMELGVELNALKGNPHLEQVYEDRYNQVTTLSTELANLRREHTEVQSRLEALTLYEEQLKAGNRAPMRAHITRAHRPSPKVDMRLETLAEWVAALSIGLVMVAIVLLIVFAPQYLVVGLAALIGLLIFLEAGFRRRLSQLVSSLVTGLAIVSAAILVFEFFWQILVAAVLTAGVYIIWENLRELARR